MSAFSAGYAYTTHRIQLIELQLLHVHVAEEIRGKSAQLLGCFYEPLKHRVRINLKDSGSGANAQPFGQAGQHVDNQSHCRLLALNNRAVMFWKITVAANAV